jgi:uncharacterized protein (UPF0335 family)
VAVVCKGTQVQATTVVANDVKSRGLESLVREGVLEVRKEDDAERKDA